MLTFKDAAAFAAVVLFIAALVAWAPIVEALQW